MEPEPPLTPDEARWFADVRALHADVDGWLRQTKPRSVYWRDLFTARFHLENILAAEESNAQHVRRLREEEEANERLPPLQRRMMFRYAILNDPLAVRVCLQLELVADELARKQPFGRMGKCGMKRGVVPRDFDLVGALRRLITRAGMLWVPQLDAARVRRFSLVLDALGF